MNYAHWGRYFSATLYILQKVEDQIYTISILLSCQSQKINVRAGTLVNDILTCVAILDDLGRQSI